MVSRGEHPWQPHASSSGTRCDLDLTSLLEPEADAIIERVTLSQQELTDSRTERCVVCGEEPGATGLDPDRLCAPCTRLLEWFRGYYADEPFDLRTITTETTFL